MGNDDKNFECSVNMNQMIDNTIEILSKNSNLVPHFIQKAHDWIIYQSSIYKQTARNLTDKEKVSLGPYFDATILDSVGVKFIDCIENPPFYQELLELGINSTLDFNNAIGMAFIDCIIVSKHIANNYIFLISVLFHEMVHIIQHHLLGTRRFLELYIMSWIQNNLDYGSIQFESEAFELQTRFDRGERAFNVADILNTQYKKDSYL